MELDFSLLADGVTPRPDGKLDIYGAGFDTIFAQSVPATHARLVLALRILVSSHELTRDHSVDVLMQTTDGEEVARAQANLSAASEEDRKRIPPGRKAGVVLVLTFENVVLPVYGAYQFALHWDGTEVREPLRLFVTELPSSDPS